MSTNKWVVWKEYTENIYFYFDVVHPDLKGKFSHLFKLIINEQGLERVKNLLDWVIDPEIWNKLKKKYKIKGPPIFNVIYGFRFSLIEDMNKYNECKVERERAEKSFKSNKKNLLLKK